AGALGRAEALYGQALAENSQDVDSLHMLGVVQYERMRYRESLETLWTAAERTGWAVPMIRHNMGLVLGKLLSRQANIRQQALLEAFVARERARRAARADVAPVVTIVLRTYNNATRYLHEAIGSILSQTWHAIEIIAIDDGSSDATPARVREHLAGLDPPPRFIAREHRGATATFNEGAGLAQGDYLAFLDASDYYALDRIERLVDEIARGRAAWGFSLVAHAFDDAGLARARGRGAFSGVTRQRNTLGSRPNSFALMEVNLATSIGNLFVERALFREIGGFEEDDVNGWNFCLRAAALAEPVVVDSPLFFRRIAVVGGDDATADADDALESERICGAFLDAVLTQRAAGRNELGPQFPANRELVLRTVFRAGRGALVPVPVMQSVAAEWRRAHSTATSTPPPVAVAHDGKAALVVLGMHRSGTSAISRVLNLCGALLPEKVTPPKLGVNPKGFWEPEAVVDLDTRLLHQLGGDWNRVDFELPSEGAVIDDFASDAAALLADEYAGAPLILVKDPRIGVLAPVWDRALTAAGYRPRYVVPVRNPLEVAQSLHARGDMSVADGLALWRAYMQRIESFVESRDVAVVYIRYADLLADWRAVVDSIAAKLDVRLDANTRSDEISRFLDTDLRNQQSGDAQLDAVLDGTEGDAIRALHARAMARCDRDARHPARTPDAMRVADADAVAPPTATFVLCIEDNAIREQALLLCESIRRFGGRQRDAAIIAYAPRTGLGVDASTQALLREFGVDYIDAPLNVECRAYGSANRVVAAAHAERHADTDFIIVLDSDTVWLGEPELPLDADVAARPVDDKGSATRGAGDPFDGYWQALAQMAGVTLDHLPWVRTTISDERVRASYNGGLVVARRASGVLGRWADLFHRSVRAGLRPYRDSGIEIVASTGAVGREASEYWGSNQAALSVAMWAGSDRVLHYPDTYNVPLHLLTMHGDVDARWLARPPLHLHYHGMFGARTHETALELIERLGVPDDRLQWLAARIPLVTDRAPATAAATAAPAPR
ncbi:MAG: glycosyltransferase, partial [Betaproteobacteria bacterium]